MSDKKLLNAVKENNINDVKKYIKKGADINVMEKHVMWKRTPLHYASEYGYYDIAEYLISKGADVNMKDQGKRTPLHLASYKGNYDIAKYLISKGANINMKDQFKYTPLHNAAVYGQYDIAKYLISKGANINMKGHDNQTPLHYASESGKDKVVELLLANGAVMTIKDYGGNTARDKAKEKGHNNIVQLFDSAVEEIKRIAEEEKRRTAELIKPRPTSYMVCDIKTSLTNMSSKLKNYKISTSITSQILSSITISDLQSTLNRQTNSSSNTNSVEKQKNMSLQFSAMGIDVKGKMKGNKYITSNANSIEYSNEKQFMNQISKGLSISDSKTEIVEEEVECPPFHSVYRRVYFFISNPPEAVFVGFVKKDTDDELDDEGKMFHKMAVKKLEKMMAAQPTYTLQ